MRYLTTIAGAVALQAAAFPFALDDALAGSLMHRSRGQTPS